MPQWLRANLLILGLLLLTALIWYVTQWAVRALGLWPAEQRYVSAAVGIVALVVNYLLARRIHRAMTRIDVDR
jgi:di/tricarboxylate transporter